MQRRWLIACVVACSSCGDNGLPPPAAHAPALPAAPAKVSGVPAWSIIADGSHATESRETMTVTVDAPPGTRVVDAWVGELPPVRLGAAAGDTFIGTLSMHGVPPGVQPVVFAADGAGVAFAGTTFQRSYAYYVLVSTDWDFSDPGDYSLGVVDTLHAHHPIVMTDFIGPYSFTDPAVSDERKAFLATWMRAERDNHGDELGLHIHPYCNFVSDAGLTCITDRSTVYTSGDTSGYTIELDAYSRDQLGVLLDHAADLFAQRGLGKPTVFRAGGWTATLDTMFVLASRGYVAESSALNWAHIATWKGVGNGVLYTWNMQHWAPIDDTSQPYDISMSDVLADTAPTLPLLEVPDNGVMMDYVSDKTLDHIFDENWAGGPLATPTTLMMGFHPSTTLSPAIASELDRFLTYADGHLATSDLGPVVYATLSDVTIAFSSQ